MQIDFEALADFLTYTVDCSADYEEDQFGVEFQGSRFYVERHRDCFRIEAGGEVLELPR